MLIGAPFQRKNAHRPTDVAEQRAWAAGREGAYPRVRLRSLPARSHRGAEGNDSEPGQRRNQQPGATGL